MNKNSSQSVNILQILILGVVCRRIPSRRSDIWSNLWMIRWICFFIDIKRFIPLVSCLISKFKRKMVVMINIVLKVTSSMSKLSVDYHDFSTVASIFGFRFLKKSDKPWAVLGSNLFYFTRSFLSSNNAPLAVHCQSCTERITAQVAVQGN